MDHSKKTQCERFFFLSTQAPRLLITKTSMFEYETRAMAISLEASKEIVSGSNSTSGLGVQPSNADKIGG